MVSVLKGIAMIRNIFLLCLITFLGVKTSIFAQNNFGVDYDMLLNYIDPILLSDGDRNILISSEYQGRVLTSTSRGFDGMSYGWFNKKMILSGQADKNKSKLGGEGRIWFGPDLGENAVFVTFDSITGNEIIKAPKDLDTLPFYIMGRSDKAITLGNRMHIENVKGFHFNIDVKRKIELLLEDKVAKSFELPQTKDFSYVAYKTSTQMTNIGTQEWSKKTGLISLWDLGCYHPTPKTTVIIPLQGTAQKASIYFTELDSTRMKIENNVLFYRADANYLNKIGTLPEITLPFFGSYSPELNLLTIVKFSFNDENLVYVNSNPANTGDQYKGDVINVFNDGNWRGEGPFGPFYELESSSPVKELKIGESIGHFQEVYHFQGPLTELNKISIQIFGVELETAVGILSE